jgi:hypothetical protein
VIIVVICRDIGERGKIHGFRPVLAIIIARLRIVLAEVVKNIDAGQFNQTV